MVRGAAGSASAVSPQPRLRRDTAIERASRKPSGTDRRRRPQP